MIPSIERLWGAMHQRDAQQMLRLDRPGLPDLTAPADRRAGADYIAQERSVSSGSFETKATTILEGNMPSPQASDLSARQRRIRFRSWHRGMREMDLVLGRFADAEIASLGRSELDDYELLLEAQDRDVFSWLTFETETPSLYDTPVFRKIRAFHSLAGLIHT